MLIKEGLASYRVRFQAIGGKLILYTDKLCFQPHSFNIIKKQVSIDISSIDTIKKRWNKLFNIIPVVPNVLEITLKDGEQYNFMVYQRSSWKNAIVNEINK